MGEVKNIIVTYLRYQMSKQSRTEVITNCFMKQSVEAILKGIDEAHVEETAVQAGIWEDKFNASNAANK